MNQEKNPNLLRVLISTDNHLGVSEKDEIRRDDSFEAFEEVLLTANNLDADFVLLGGDLFHENKPSRSTLVKAIQIITRHSMNDKPVAFQVLSDEKTNFVSGKVNFMDPNLNVGLPIFTIHGNHDDPSGPDNLSAVDILSSCNLVNYFGKYLLGGSTIGKVTISPILLQKGDTRLCLYGLGNVRDERLARLFSMPGMVSWLRPEPTPEAGADDWVNVMVVHQNRVERGAQAKNSLQEAHLPPFLDLVVWGHEHECRPDPEELRNASSSAARGTLVVQPGSSVVTSLSEGEAARKHMFLLEVLGNSFRLVKFPLRTVRPFVWRAISLKDAPGVRAEDPETITAFLEAKVNEMIKQASEDYPAEAGKAKLPLIRLRVDYTGFSTINAQRFGQKFVGKVANPQDLLIWSKAANRKVRGEGQAAAAAAEDSDELLRPEALDQQRIEDLVASNLQHTLRVLHEEDLAAALHNYVEKEDKQALVDVLQRTLVDTQQPMLQNLVQLSALGDDDKELEEAVSMCVRERRVAKATNAALGGPDSAPATVPHGGPLTATPLQPPPGAGAGASLLDQVGTRDYGAPSTGVGGGGGLDLIEDDDLNTGGAAATTTRRGKAAGKPPAAPASAAKGRGGRGSRGGAAAGRAGLRQPSLFEAYNRMATTQNNTQGGAPSAAPQSAAGHTQASVGGGRRGGGAARAAAPAASDSILDSDLEDDVGEQAEVAAGGRKRAGGGTPSRRSTRPAARRPAKRTRLDSDDDAAVDDDDSDAVVVEDDDDDDDDSGDYIEEEDEDEGPANSRRGGSGKAGSKRSRATAAKQPLKTTQATATPAAGRARKGASTAGTPSVAPAASETYVIDSDDENALGRPSVATGATGATGTTAASAGARRKPASFLMSVASQQQQRPAAGRGMAKNWGAARQ